MSNLSYNEAKNSTKDTLPLFVESIENKPSPYVHQQAEQGTNTPNRATHFKNVCSCAEPLIKASPTGLHYTLCKFTFTHKGGKSQREETEDVQTCVTAHSERQSAALQERVMFF